jgi:hypothetical protein
LVEQSLIKNDVDLAAYEVRVKDFVSDAQIQIDKRRADMDYADRLHRGELSAIESNDRLRDITRRAELERLSAVADSHSLGANLYAAMAQGAMSSVNSIAEVAIAAEE